MSGPGVILDRRAFVLEHSRLQHPPHTPEIALHLADEVTPLWRLTEEELGEMGVPPPFWAFAWAKDQVGISRRAKIGCSTFGSKLDAISLAAHHFCVRGAK